MATLGIFCKALVALTAFLAAAQVLEALVVIKAERKIDLQSVVVRNIVTLKLENPGETAESRVLIGLSPRQSSSLAFASVVLVTGKAKSKVYADLPYTPLPISEGSNGLPSLAVELPQPLQPGASATLEVYLTFSGLLTPFPAEITQSDSQLLLFEDSSYVASVYPVKSQTTVVKLPSSRVESFEAADPSRKSDSELKLGPYDNIEAGAEAPLVVHFENNRPFPVAVSLTRELEVSHWGNVYVTEDYDIEHQGAKLKGVFSRLELQMRPQSSGVPSLKGLAATLPKNARAVYFRDEIGNISTSNFRTEKRRSVLELATRYPLFGGWRSTFTIGYSVPLPDLVFLLPDGTRVLNATFGTPFQELPVQKLTVKVVLPEGSFGVATEVPFDLTQKATDTKFSYLDVLGRPVVVLVKENVVQEHSMQHFLVKYSISPISLLVEPLLLTAAFALFFLACAVYVRLDLTISKSSPAYQAKLLTDRLMDALQQLGAAAQQRLKCVDALEASLVKLGRTGDAALAKLTRRHQEDKLKELQKALKDALAVIEGVPRAPKSLALAQQIVAKDAEYVEKALKKHGLSVEAVEKSLPVKDIERSIAPLVDRLNELKAELKALLIELDE